MWPGRAHWHGSRSRRRRTERPGPRSRLLLSPNPDRSSFRWRSDARLGLRHAAMQLRRLALLGIETLFGIVAGLGRRLRTGDRQSAAHRHLHRLIALAVLGAVLADADVDGRRRIEAAARMEEDVVGGDVDHVIVNAAPLADDRTLRTRLRDMRVERYQQGQSRQGPEIS